MADKRDEELEILRQMLMRHDDDIVRHDDGIDVLRKNVQKHDEDFALLKEMLLQIARIQLEEKKTAAEIRKQTEENFRILSERAAQNEENIGILIKMMDEWIRSNRKDNGAV